MAWLPASGFFPIVVWKTFVFLESSRSAGSEVPPRAYKYWSLFEWHSPCNICKKTVQNVESLPITDDPALYVASLLYPFAISLFVNSLLVILVLVSSCWQANYPWATNVEDTMSFSFGLWKSGSSSDIVPCLKSRVITLSAEKLKVFLAPSTGSLKYKEFLKLKTGNRSETDTPFYESEPEEGEIREDEPPGPESPNHKDIGINAIKLSSSQEAIIKQKVDKMQSTSHERDTYQEGIANTVVQKLEYGASEGRTINTRQLALHGTCSGGYTRSYLPDANNTSTKRHKQKEHGHYKYSDYPHVLKTIEKVSSRRFNKLLAWHNEDRKEFNVLFKKLELDFFQEHVRSYEVQYTRVIPTIKQRRMKLPKQCFSILRESFHKHFQSKLIEFVKQQIKDRDKENRIRKRWIFEAEAGYLKKDFDMVPLSYSGLKIEKLKCPLTDYSNGDILLNCFNMECLSTEIQAIASLSTEPEDTCAGKRSNASEPIPENSQLLLEINGSTEDKVSVGAAEEVFTYERSSQSTCEPTTVVFGENNGTEIDFPVAAQSTVGHTELPNAPRSDIGAGLAHANLVASDSGNVPSIAKGRCLSSGYDVSEGSSSRFQRELQSEPSSSLCKNVLLHKETPSTNHHISLDPISLQETPCANQQISLETISPQEAPFANQQISSDTISPLEVPSASSPSPNVIQMEQEQPEDISNKKAPNSQASSFAQVTEQPDMHANTSTCQVVTHQPPDGNTHSVRNGFISPQESNIEPDLVNQIITVPSEVGFQSDPIANELSRLQMLRVLMAKRHEEKRQQLILACEIEMAETKRKYDELIYKSEMERLQRKKELKILSDKVYKQQILAEEFQSMFVSHRSRGAAKRSLAEPNRSSGQQALQPPASISAAASAADAQSSIASGHRLGVASLEQ
ncbi:uncharacterized protein LOC102717405 [Oryza brachyantha]|uniref:uncharacterized protein LOC102717405 n=1 Tax=Oryza brachyantha TaxID=4533 RepID=UPI0007764226|nr:uncharacterized protein LOC102717405 [Oryza brachyantha]